MEQRRPDTKVPDLESMTVYSIWDKRYEKIQQLVSKAYGILAQDEIKKSIPSLPVPSESSLSRNAINRLRRSDSSFINAQESRIISSEILSNKEASLFLHTTAALDNSSPMNDDSFKIRMCLQLDIPLVKENTLCPGCGLTLDKFGGHSLCCKDVTMRSLLRNNAHYLVNNAFFKTCKNGLRDVNLKIVKEPATSTFGMPLRPKPKKGRAVAFANSNSQSPDMEADDDEGVNPDIQGYSTSEAAVMQTKSKNNLRADIAIYPASDKHQAIMFDTTITHAAAQNNFINKDSYAPRDVANLAADRKIKKYEQRHIFDSKSQPDKFYPLAFTTTGVFSTSTISAIKKIQLLTEGGVTKQQLRQALAVSLAIARANQVRTLLSLIKSTPWPKGLASLKVMTDDPEIDPDVDSDAVEDPHLAPASETDQICHTRSPIPAVASSDVCGGGVPRRRVYPPIVIGGLHSTCVNI